MKVLKGRGGLIGKGMTENVRNAWTKSVHRYTELKVSCLSKLLILIRTMFS